MTMRVATDVGGTFTDLVCIDDDGIRITKSDTTPPNFEEGVINVLEKGEIDPGQIDDFVHGTTVVINALLSRRGAKTGLITTRGFRDILEIARGNRPDLFNFAFKKPAPFVPRYLRHEITERLDYLGRVVEPLQLDEIEPILEALKSEGVQAVAICCLHAYVNPEHELAIEARIRELWPEVSVIASHKVCGEWREYERTSTAVLSAYVHPIAKGYLASLDEKLSARGLSGKPLIMRSNGGVATVEGARNDPISMVESGPASGVLGAAALGKQIGEPNLIALDIGGTTAKTALIESGAAKITTSYKIEWDRTNPGYPIRTPVVDLVEIGNGGGSIAWVDKGGRMHVGPQSVGSQPGPAAYGRGGKHVTTTDANLVLGRINPKLFLGGEQEPDWDSIDRAFEPLMEALGETKEDIARGVIGIANANMVNALKLVSLNRGYDPRDFALIAFGGGGAMHAVALAEELMTPKVIIPVNSSVFSAWGMLMCDLRRDFLKTDVKSVTSSAAEAIEATYEAMEAQARETCLAEGMPAEAMRVERFADMRYAGQEHTVKVPAPHERLDPAALTELISAFHQEHMREYTFQLDSDVELVNFHVVVFADIDKKPLPALPVTGRNVSEALKGVRKIDFDADGVHDTNEYALSLIEPGMAIAGPAVLEDPTATIVISPGKRAEMDAYGNIHIQMRTS
ncbi:hydantoinase/oxoprolinase family protein [Marinicaulis aureus]|uniref:Hydantoinase/oxoprolinase family protein n=1 Tax=Hyphococcus aureus TaxID=2666033 RepID=A0ABW1L068_9PROT